MNWKEGEPCITAEGIQALRQSAEQGYTKVHETCRVDCLTLLALLADRDRLAAEVEQARKLIQAAHDEVDGQINRKAAAALLAAHPEQP
jgi:hypothetical protein